MDLTSNSTVKLLYCWQGVDVKKCRSSCINNNAVHVVTDDTTGGRHEEEDEDEEKEEAFHADSEDVTSLAWR